MWIFQLYNDYQLNLQDPVACQRNELEMLKAVYQFEDYQDFSDRFVPISDREIAPAFLENADFFVRSSGTSAAARFIPITHAYLEANHYKTGRYALYNLLFHFRQLQVLSGANLTLTGYKYPKPHLTKEVYDISALIFDKRPVMFKAISVPRQIFFGWQEKLEFLLDHPEDTLKIRSISGVPTWMFSLFNAFEERFQKPTHELFPNLNLVVHGGVDFTNYFGQFRATFPDREISFFENYNATEGFYGFQYTPESPNLLLSTNAGIFFEFIDQAGRIRPLWDVQAGAVYEVLITNQDGLCRYRTGDMIQIQELTPLLFRFAGRTSEFINAFGEDLLVSQSDRAIHQLNQRFGLHITDYLAFPVYGSARKRGYHQWYIFSDHPDPVPSEWAAVLDQYLIDLNNNYRQKREKSAALQPLRLKVLNRDQLDAIIQKAGKEVGGQAKLKKLYNLPEKVLPYLS